jgi:hypothetical protein
MKPAVRGESMPEKVKGLSFAIVEIDQTMQATSNCSQHPRSATAAAGSNAEERREP